jgi:hypothetical protein
VSVSFCPACGAEYVAGVVECVDCLVELVPGRAEVLAEGSEEDEVVFELSDWEPELRAELGRVLGKERLAYRWEGDGDLVVRDEDGDRVDQLLDAVEFPDALEADDGEGDDEAGHAAMSELFLAADRLMGDPGDAKAATDLVGASEVVHALHAPFGFGPEAWMQIRELAASVCDDLATDADDDVIVGDARTLREVLRRYI